MAQRRAFNEQVLAQRRKQESDRAVFDQQARTNRTLLSLAQWEVSTDAKIDRNATRKRAEEMRRAVNADLDRRRQQLANLLEDEDRQYQAELEAMEETTQQRAERLKARARELVRRREAERREMAQQQLTRQFRENNDQFREIDSRRILEQCLVDREQAIKTKEVDKVRQKKDDEYWHTQWMGVRDKMIQREEKDKSRQLELRAEMMNILEKQLIELEQRRKDAQLLKEEDARIMKERFDLDIEEARRKEEARKRMFQEKKAEITVENTRLRLEKQRKLQVEREEDLRLLNAMLDAERQAEAKEQAYKKRLSDQARDYRHQLEMLMQKEAVSEAAAEAIRAAEQEKAFRKREEEWDKERVYREQLMKEVLAVRRAQLEEQKENNRRKRHQAMVEREELQRELEEIAREEKAAQEDREFVKMEHQRELLAQIEEHRFNLDEEKRLELMEMEAAKQSELEYQRAVEMEMRSQRPMKNHGLKTFSWST